MRHWTGKRNYATIIPVLRQRTDTPGYALLDLASVIRREHLEAALALWRYCEASAAFVFGDSLGDAVADAILSALRQRLDLGMTRTEMRW